MKWLPLLAAFAAWLVSCTLTLRPIKKPEPLPPHMHAHKSVDKHTPAPVQDDVHQQYEPIYEKIPPPPPAPTPR